MEQIVQTAQYLRISRKGNSKELPSSLDQKQKPSINYFLPRLNGSTSPKRIKFHGQFFSSSVRSPSLDSGQQSRAKTPKKSILAESLAGQIPNRFPTPCETPLSREFPLFTPRRNSKTWQTEQEQPGPVRLTSQSSNSSDSSVYDLLKSSSRDEFESFKLGGSIVSIPKSTGNPKANSGGVNANQKNLPSSFSSGYPIQPILLKPPDFRGSQTTQKSPRVQFSEDKSKRTSNDPEELLKTRKDEEEEDIASKSLKIEKAISERNAFFWHYRLSPNRMEFAKSQLQKSQNAKKAQPKQPNSKANVLLNLKIPSSRKDPLTTDRKSSREADMESMMSRYQGYVREVCKQVLLPLPAFKFIHRKTMIISHYVINQSNYGKALGNVIKESSIPISNVVLCHNRMKDKCAARLLEIGFLNAQRNPRTRSSLKVLKYNGNSVGLKFGEAFQKLAGVGTFGNLREISLTSCSFMDIASQTFLFQDIKGLSNNLLTLNLQKSRIHPKNFKLFCDLLYSKGPGFENLNISQTGLTARQTFCVIDILGKRAQKLRQLMLAHNPLVLPRNRTMACLIVAIESNRNLVHLDISDCHLELRHCLDLFKLLSLPIRIEEGKNTFLMSLHLSGNFFSTEDIAQALSILNGQTSKESFGVFTHDVHGSSGDSLSEKRVKDPQMDLFDQEIVSLADRKMQELQWPSFNKDIHEALFNNRSIFVKLKSKVPSYESKFSLPKTKDTLSSLVFFRFLDMEVSSSLGWFHSKNCFICERWKKTMIYVDLIHPSQAAETQNFSKNSRKLTKGHSVVKHSILVPEDSSNSPGLNSLVSARDNNLPSFSEISKVSFDSDSLASDLDRSRQKRIKKLTKLVSFNGSFEIPENPQKKNNERQVDVENDVFVKFEFLKNHPVWLKTEMRTRRNAFCFLLPPGTHSYQIGINRETSSSISPQTLYTNHLIVSPSTEDFEIDPQKGLGFIPFPSAFRKEYSVFRNFVAEDYSIIQKMVTLDLKNSTIPLIIDSPEELPPIQVFLERHYKTFRSHFSNYSASSATYPLMDFQSFFKFAVDSKFMDKIINTSFIEDAFKVLLNKHSATFPASSSPKKGLCRYDFVEMLFLISKAKYLATGRVTTLLQSLEKLQREDILVNTPDYSWMYENYREEKVYTVAVNQLLEANLDGLSRFFSQFQNTNGLIEIPVLKKIIVNVFRLKEASERDFMRNFTNSKQAVIDESTSATKYTGLGFAEFLEWICRVSDSSIASEEGKTLEMVQKLDILLEKIMSRIQMKKINPKENPNN